jgi:pimeloyl-ACP methyl ester carboxylesterase
LRERTQVKTIEVNGTELHYVERGEGEPVVFVHGGLGDFRTWLPQVESFSICYRAISYSRRAHYPNAWPPDYTLALLLLHVEDLAALIEGLGLGRTHIVANSYGSYISLHLALKYPHMVSALALAEPPLHPLLRTLPGGEEMFDSFMHSAWGPAGEAFRHGDLEGGVRLFIEGAVGPGEWDKLSPRAREAMLKDAPELAIATHTPFEVHMPPLTCDDLAHIEAPVLLMRGEHSPHMYTLINNELARCLPRVEQAVIPGASHVLHVHNQEEHDRVVLEFLLSVER